MAGTRPFLGTEISLDEIDYTVSIFFDHSITYLRPYNF